MAAVGKLERSKWLKRTPKNFQYAEWATKKI